MDMTVSSILLSASILFLVYFFQFLKENQKVTFLESLDIANFNMETKKEVRRVYEILRKYSKADAIGTALSTKGFQEWEESGFMASCRGVHGSLLFMVLENKIHSGIYSANGGNPVRLVRADECCGKLVR